MKRNDLELATQSLFNLRANNMFGVIKTVRNIWADAFGNETPVKDNALLSMINGRLLDHRRSPSFNVYPGITSSTGVHLIYPHYPNRIHNHGMASIHKKFQI
ncbi:MAG: hypothetical protein P8012_16030, partial [Desulfobacterales bacterium]